MEVKECLGNAERPLWDIRRFGPRRMRVEGPRTVPSIVSDKVVIPGESEVIA